VNIDVCEKVLHFIKPIFDDENILSAEVEIVAGIFHYIKSSKPNLNLKMLNLFSSYF